MKWIVLGLWLLSCCNYSFADRECIEPGDRVLSRWKNGYYYKGTVETITNKVNVLYDTGIRFFFNERTREDIVPDVLPENDQIPYEGAVVAQRPRSRAFELGYVKGINWATGKYVVLHEDGDTIYHTLDELRLFNKSIVCDEPAYLGCFRDHIPRNIPLYIPMYPATVATCVDTCKSRGFSICGIRNTDLCFCGNSYDRRYQVGEEVCNETCYNNPYEVCGGTNSYSTYWNGIVEGLNLNFVGGVMRHHVIRWPSQQRLSYYKAIQREYIARNSNTAKRITAYKRPRVWTRYRTQAYNRYPNSLSFQRQLSSPSQYSTYTAGYYKRGPNYRGYYKGANSQRGPSFIDQRSKARPNLDINPRVVGGLMAKIPYPSQILRELADLISLVDWKESPNFARMFKNLPKGKGFRFLGCFRDNNQSPDLRLTASTRIPLTVGSCALKCRLRGYSVAGLQASRCLCDQVYGRYGRLRNDQCQTPCLGNRTEVCGGYSANSVYYTGQGDAIPYKSLQDAARKTNSSKSIKDNGHNSKISRKSQSSSKKKAETSKFKGRNKSSKTQFKISKSDLDQLKRKVESTIQLRIKVVRGSNKKKKPLKENLERKTAKINKIHLKGNKNSTIKKNSKKMRKTKNSATEDKHYVQQQNQVTNNSKEEQKVIVPVTEADHYPLKSNKTSLKISEFNKQHPFGKTHGKKTLSIVPKLKFKIRNKALKPVFITNISTSVKIDGDKTKENSTKIPILVEKSLRLATVTNKTNNSQKQHFTIVQRTTEAHQANFSTPTNETDSVEEDIFKKSIVPTPPGYRGVEKYERLSLKKLKYGSDRMVHEAQLHLKRLHLKKQNIVTTKLRSLGKSLNANKNTNGKPSVAKSTKKSLSTARLETRKSPKRKISKKIVNVEAIRVRFEEENQDDDESSGNEKLKHRKMSKYAWENLSDDEGSGHERLKHRKTTKSAWENLSDDASRNEILGGE